MSQLPSNREQSTPFSLVLAPVLVLLAVLIPSAHGAAVEWRGIDVEPGPQPALNGARSPNLVHEYAISEPQTVTISATEVTVRADDHSMHWSWTDGSTTTEHQHALARDPAIVDLPLPSGRYALTIRRDAWGRAKFASAHGARIHQGDITAWLVDSNLDGDLGTHGDGLVIAGSLTVGPLLTETQIWGLRSAIAIRQNAEGKWQQQSLSMPYPKNRDHTNNWCRLNRIRQQCGLLPLRYDRSLESGMREHAAYMATNRHMAHHQDANRPGASAAGAQAAANCNITSWASGHSEALNEFLLTLFHRDGLLAPELSATAMVIDHGFGLIDVRSHNRSLMRGGVLIYPPHGSDSAPTEFARGERPHPIAPSHNRRRIGPPIGLYLRDLWFSNGLPTDPQLTVSQTRRRRSQAIDGEVFSVNNQPPHLGASGITGYGGAVSFIPKRPLPSGKTMSAQLNVTLDRTTLLRTHRARATSASSLQWQTAQDLRYDWSFRTE